MIAATDAAGEVAAVLRAHAREVDERAAFPEAGFAELRRSGLMGLVVPEADGGMGGSIRQMARVAEVLGGACLSTAMIWAMHCQQVAVIADHAPADLRRRALARVVGEGALVASVTSERGKGGHLLTALAPLERSGDEMVLRRRAPVVTGGRSASCFLITMRAAEDRPPSDVRLVYAEREQLAVRVEGTWNAQGMRGTDSVPMALEGRLPAGQVIDPAGGFRAAALSTMVPVGHIAWAACWLGAARGALAEMIGVFRDPAARGQFDVNSDRFFEHLARIRLRLDVVRACLDQVLDEYEALRLAVPGEPRRFEAGPFQIRVNDLKVFASETLFAAVDDLVQLAGLQYGYLRNRRVALERTYRDLRSASLMYANERLLLANGRLALLDREVTLGGR